MSVRKRGGRWYCRFQIDGVRYERRCSTAVDERTALQAEKIIMAEIMRGDLDYAKAKKAIKLKEGINLFEKYSKGNKLSYKSDIYYIDKVLKYFGENCILESITPSKIEEFKEFLKSYKTISKIKIDNPEYGKNGCRKKYIYKEIGIEKKRANSTINRHVEMLSKMFNLCIDNGLIESNPCRSVGQLREDNFKIRYLTPEEEKALYNAIEELEKEGKSNYRYLKNIITCALQTGMRRAEIFNLKWSQIDFKEGFIEVLKTKSGKSRKIPISTRLESVLKEILATSNNSYVFINPDTNKPYKDIKKAFSTVLQRANIKNFRFHDLRHTVATRMVESGVDLIVVQEILGHDIIQTTMRYAHSVPENKKRAVEFLANSY